MTTSAFAARVSPNAQAMLRAFELASAGQKQGTFECPGCHSQVRYTATAPHKTEGHCTAGCGVRWAVL